MKPSLSYYLTIWTLRLMGIKKIFSTDPINYQKLRKFDVYSPKSVFFKQRTIETCQILDSKITKVKSKRPTNTLLIFIHGGAFISGPVSHHWSAVKTIAKSTNYHVWLCDYPKAPEHDINTISQNIQAIYQTALTQYPSDNILFMGDSAGATLTTSLMQYLAQNKLPLPRKIVLISPVMDTSMTNPNIAAIDLKDPMLSVKGLLSAKKMCARNMELNNPLISPLYGNFSGFPKTLIFIAENDVISPDIELAVQKLEEANTDLEVIRGKNMPHIWPLLPVMKEAKTAMKQVIDFLNAS